MNKCANVSSMRSFLNVHARSLNKIIFVMQVARAISLVYSCVWVARILKAHNSAGGITYFAKRMLISRRYLPCLKSNVTWMTALYIIRVIIQRYFSKYNWTFVAVFQLCIVKLVVRKIYFSWVLGAKLPSAPRWNDGVPQHSTHSNKGVE